MQRFVTIAPRLALVAFACAASSSPAAAQAPPPANPLGFAPPPAPPDALAAALAPKPGGLTAEEVGRIVARTKHSVRAKQEELKAAAAKVDQAFVGYFPRLSLTATYTRLSPVSAFSLGAGGLVGSQNPGSVFVAAPGTKNCPAASPGGCVVDAQGLPVKSVGVSFPIPLNSTSFVASLAVPISDYVLRISQGYASASHNEKSKRLDLDAEMLQGSSDGKIIFYNWVQAKGQVIVAQQAVEQAKAHVEDAKKSFAVGLTSRADVLRLDAQHAAAEQMAAEAEALQSVSAEQLRIALGAPPDQRFEVGVDVLHEPAAAPAESLQAAQDQAFQRRLEIRALDETVYSLKEVEAVTKAGYLPRLDAFADATYANPNQRIFPAQDHFDFTWDVGLRLSWTINDTFTTIGAAAEARARTAGVAEQRANLRDALRVEVASAHADAVKAPANLEAAERGLASAEESYRVRRELFRAGKATSVDLVDAETEVTRARLSRLNAHVMALVARARLDHASGKDAPAPKAGEPGPGTARGPVRGPVVR